MQSIDYQNQNSQQTLREGLKDIITASSLKDWFWWMWQCFLPCCRAIAYSLQMNKKWYTYDFYRYLNVPLTNIRQEYNIKVMQQGETALIPSQAVSYYTSSTFLYR